MNVLICTNFSVPGIFKYLNEDISTKLYEDDESQEPVGPVKVRRERKKEKRLQSPYTVSLDYNHNTTTTSVLISIFEEKILASTFDFCIYIYMFHRGQDGEHSHKKSPRKSADPGVIYNIPEKKYSAITGIWLYKFSLQLTSCKSNGDAMLYIKSQNLMSVVLVLE